MAAKKGGVARSSVGWQRSEGRGTSFLRARHMGGYASLSPPTLLRTVYNGKLSCFFAGISTFLSFSIASARAMRRRVECGMMTSSR